MLGPPPLNSPKDPVKVLRVSIGPVTLDIRPLSPYQQSLITIINTLGSQCWSDRQIANYFNESGYLTPRGCRWLPKNVFSIRKKHQMRIARLGEVIEVRLGTNGVILGRLDDQINS